jgi:VCBS repeat protein
MERNTRSLSPFSQRQKLFATIVLRFSVAVLLVSGVILATTPGPMRSEAQSQTTYTVASFNAGANPSAAKIGDLDGDGLNDIAVVNRQGDLQLFFNNGAGSFQRESLTGLWPSTANTRDLAIGDLNGDGRNDIAVAFATQTGALSVLLNQGSRTFSAPANYNSCSFSNGIAIGDLDQDGDNDLADISQCNRSSVLRNNGQGGFALSGAYGDGSGSSSIALADLNRDGSKDIVYLNNSSVTILLNNGNATFGSPLVYWVWDAVDLAVGDFEGDGTVDIATVSNYYSLVFILINGGDGEMISYSEIPSYGSDAPTGIVVGDFNGDGRPPEFALISGGTSSVTVFLNQGYYTYGHTNPINVGQTPVDIAAGKLDGDSLPDLVTIRAAGAYRFSSLRSPRRLLLLLQHR